MKRALLSIIILLSLTSLLAGGTLAGFSDTEASLGNEFTTGALDIKVAKVDGDWVGDDFRDDLPWGTGLEPVFNIECARICSTYSVYHLIHNLGEVDGTAFLHIRLTNDSGLIAGTTYVSIWYDVDGNGTIEDPEEKVTEATLLSLHSNPQELGLLPGCNTRRLKLEIHPNVGPGEGSRSFELGFDIEFQLTQESCHYTDTETSSGYLVSCGEGCTPGAWKTRLLAIGEWEETGYSPEDILKDVFEEVGMPAYAPIKNKTLLEALEFLGGDSLREKAQILLRAGVAALLNASHPDVDYPRSESEVIDDVNDALASLDEDTIIDLATDLDNDNNLGCPFD
jgi:predicted ribosomally synthesized peptide with SipW-like signal peptide